MASARKSRPVNKRFSMLNEESPDKDGDMSNKSRVRKRKLSDMLGSQWSKDELERFYDAYRKYGKDWRKVAIAIRNRSTDMVEALYNMNKVYLSLRDGMATAAGLIAMMTDHYNNQEGSESDRESNDGTRLLFNAQKKGRGKYQINNAKRSTGSHSEHLPYNSTTSNFGCLSLLKKKRSDSGSQPRVVGKRTPRFPVSYGVDRSKKDKALFPKRHGLKLEQDTDDDDGVHVAALALTQAYQRGGTPKVSQTVFGKKVLQKDSKKFPELEARNSKSSLHWNEEHREGSLGSREAETEDFVRDCSRNHDHEGGETVAMKHKIRKTNGKRIKAVTKNNFDDTKEACSGTEEGLNGRSIKESMDISDKKLTMSSHSSRRSRKLLSGDEHKEFDALQTLADLSLNMLIPSFAMESESSIQVKDEKRSIDVIEKVGIPEKMPKHYQRDKRRIAVNKEKSQLSTAAVDTVKQKTCKTDKISSNMDVCARRQETLAINRYQKRKNKLTEEKAPKSVADEDKCMDESHTMEGAVEDNKKVSNRVKWSGPNILSPGHVNPANLSENSSSSTDMSKTATDPTELAPQVSATSEVRFPVKAISRRKMALKNIMAQRHLKSDEHIGENRPDRLSISTNEKTMHLKEILSRCLSAPLLRRWCMFEWFYSAIDYPWFAKSEFVEYLNHVGLGHVPRLTRIEWGVIRSSLGKPRRLSQNFLKEEREKLEQYRESVRSHYAELRAGVRDGVPTDLARPLSVGQRVIAYHPKTREIHDGSVLTVDHNKCLVQFDQFELGVESVMDVDCMPLNPSENMPDALKKCNVMVDRLADSHNRVKPYHFPKEWKLGISLFPPVNRNRETDESNSFSGYAIDTLVKQAEEDSEDAVGQAKAAINQATVAARHAMYTQPCTLAQIQAKEDDIKVLAELARALDKKEALLIELRKLNVDVPLMQKEGESRMDMEHFRKQCAMVLVQLRAANELVSSALLSVRQRNTYQGCPTLCFRPSDNTNGTFGIPCSLDQLFLNQESSSLVAEIVEGAKQQARTMVDVAMKAVSSVNNGEDALPKVQKAIDDAKKWQSFSDPGDPPAKSNHGTNRGYCIVASNSGSSETIISNVGHDLKCLLTDRDECQFPSELISSCVSSALMIQRCTEKQLPPAEVAQILESAVSSLSPSCSQNIPIYREIEEFMGAIKNQMLALVPSPSLTFPIEHSVA